MPGRSGESAENSREVVLRLLRGERPGRVPCFSGLISVTSAGLASVGVRLAEAHHDPARLAALAASSFRLFGFESATLPLDLCVEAEALGAGVDFRAEAAMPEFPRVDRPLADSAAELVARWESEPPSLARRGRLPVAAEALRRLKAEVGQQVVVGAWVPGPLTLAMQLVNPGSLMTDLVEAPETAGRLLDAAARALAEAGQMYHAAGADFLTVHEMGGSPGYIGPRPFERLVLPRLQALLGALPRPRVLSVCGNTNRAMPLLAQAQADALGVDQLNDLARSRALLGPGRLLFGNLDPVAVLAQGEPEAVRQAVRAAIAAGVDAVWPGCDLWPPVPEANMRAMVKAARG